MLAVTANWLLTDGTLAASRTAAAEEWLRSIRRAAIRAGRGRDGRYQPVESLCLVFAGDTFDWLLSDVWAGDDRPWHAGQRGRAARARVATASLWSARYALRSLRRWLRRGMPVPAADTHGRPSARAIRHATVHVVMLTGDRDAWIDEAAPAAARWGGLVGEMWSDAHVSIRHGHDIDPLCSAAMAAPERAMGRPPTLGESLAVDLVVPFVMALRSEPAVWSLARPRMAALASASPGALPLEVAKLLRPWGQTSVTGRRLLNSWRSSIGGWRLRAVREPPSWDTEHDVLDAIADWFMTAADGHAATVPASIARLAIPRMTHDQPGHLLGHVGREGAAIGLGRAGVPWLAVINRVGGPEWTEPLGPVPGGSGVVAIGATHGRRIVEAA